jgi:hypothetical protein
MLSIVNKFNPEVILVFGKTASNAILQLPIGDDVIIIHACHPTNRGDRSSLYLIKDKIKEISENVNNTSNSTIASKRP